MTDDDARVQADADAGYARWRAHHDDLTLDKVMDCLTWRPERRREYSTGAHTSSRHLASAFHAADRLLARVQRFYQPSRDELATGLAQVTTHAAAILPRLLDPTSPADALAHQVHTARQHLHHAHQQLHELATDVPLDDPDIVEAARSMRQARTRLEPHGYVDTAQVAEIATLLAAVFRPAAGIVYLIDLVTANARKGELSTTIGGGYVIRGGSQWWQCAATLTHALYALRAIPPGWCGPTQTAPDIAAHHSWRPSATRVETDDPR
jgi:hypothetical protein